MPKTQTEDSKIKNNIKKDTNKKSQIKPNDIQNNKVIGPQENVTPYEEISKNANDNDPNIVNSVITLGENVKMSK